MNVLIGAAALLLVGSAAALVGGWGTSREALIWTSIAASAGAAVVLAVAYLRTRKAPAPPIAAPGDADAVGPAGVTTVSASAPPAVADRSKTRPETPARKSTASKTTGAGPSSSTRSDEVVAIPERKKFHRPDCRYAQAKGAERMTKAAARKRDYSACGICKP